MSSFEQGLNFQWTSHLNYNSTLNFYKERDFENFGRFAMIATRSSWDQYDWEFYKAGEKNLISSQMKIFENDYLWVGSSWLVQPNNFIGETLDKYILELHQHGIIEHYLDLVSLPKVPEFEKDPEKLTMFMLSAGFLVWITAVSIACIEFICEVIMGHLLSKREKNRIIDEFQRMNDSNVCFDERKSSLLTENKRFAEEEEKIFEIIEIENEMIIGELGSIEKFSSEIKIDNDTKSEEIETIELPDVKEENLNCELLCEDKTRELLNERKGYLSKIEVDYEKLNDETIEFYNIFEKPTKSIADKLSPQHSSLSDKYQKELNLAQINKEERDSIHDMIVYVDVHCDYSEKSDESISILSQITELVDSIIQSSMMLSNAEQLEIISVISLD